MARIHRELYKKQLHDPDNHDGVITHLEPDILECEVKWWNSSWAIPNPERWCCESAALNMPANFENSTVATGLEKVSFHSNPKERQWQRMLKLPHRWHSPYGKSSEKGLKNLLMKVKEDSEQFGLKLNSQQTKIIASNSITPWQIDEETMETVRDYLFGLQNHCRWWLQPWN